MSMDVDALKRISTPRNAASGLTANDAMGGIHRVNRDDLQSKAVPAGDDHINARRGRVPGPHSALIELLPIAPDLEDDTALAPDFVVDSEVDGEGRARAVQAELDRGWRRSAEALRVRDPVEPEGLAIPRPRISVAGIPFDGPALVRHVGPWQIAQESIDGRPIRPRNPEEREPMGSNAYAASVRERAPAGSGPEVADRRAACG